MLCLWLGSCGNPGKGSEIVTDSDTVSETQTQIDSLSENTSMTSGDSLAKTPQTGSKTEVQGETGSKLTPQNGSLNKSTGTGTAIKHGSPDPQKLDSIKNAKLKGKL